MGLSTARVAFHLSPPSPPLATSTFDIRTKIESRKVFAILIIKRHEYLHRRRFAIRVQSRHNATSGYSWAVAGCRLLQRLLRSDDSVA